MAPEVTDVTRLTGTHEAVAWWCSILLLVAPCLLNDRRRPVCRSSLVLFLKGLANEQAAYLLRFGTQA